LRRLIGYLPMAAGLYRWWRRNSSGGTDRPDGGRWVRMFRETSTGAWDGEVLQGAQQGRRLSGMGLTELLALRDECRADDPSAAAAVEVFLDEHFGGAWRQSEGSGSNSGPLKRDEALAILGLGPEATSEEIVAAHRRLMQKLHPDRGGSDYLAARINEAKVTLLGGRRRSAAG
jgi:hypothetical protein